MLQRLTAMVALAACAALAMSDTQAQPKPTLDYEFFKARVEPVFLKKRAGHTRCVVCHGEEANNAFRLTRLPPGEKAWKEEQSRRNFETVAKLVTPGDPGASRLTTQPLAPEAGGNVYHSGGRQFASKEDADYRNLVQWINGATLAARARK
jgi:hypothetical protein